MSQDNDLELYEIIQQALVPAGHRPRSLKDIEAMLKACADEAVPEEKLQRMLRKVRGEEAVGVRPDPVVAAFEQTLTEEQRELIALHRSEGADFPPEIKAMLEKFREEIRKQQQARSDGDKDGGRL